MERTRPSPGHSITLRVAAPAGLGAPSTLTAAAATAGAEVTALDVVESTHDGVLVDLTCNAADDAHAGRVTAAVDALPGVDVGEVRDHTFAMHAGGKLRVVPTAELRTSDDLSRAYTPGVARVCLAIAADPIEARRLTVKANTVAVVTNGTAVLGLGDIGPAAVLPVMEGKAALFKQFADVDAWPVCLDARDTDEVVAVVKAIAPTFGGINLEDIAAPQCFEIERRLRAELDVPVFHDDQHGTAVVVLAALLNALRVVGKDLTDARVVVSGAGAAGHAIAQLLHSEGAAHLVVCDRRGAIHADRGDTDPHRRWIAEHTNPERVAGSLHDVLVGADVFIGVSAPGVVEAQHVATMAEGAVVLALANPDPEIHPHEAARHAAVVATGRSDFPNQINNVLAFPGLFRGLLDVGARAITTPMLVAAARAIADCVHPDELDAQHVVPSVFDPRVAPAVAAAVAATATDGEA